MNSLRVVSVTALRQVQRMSQPALMGFQQQRLFSGEGVGKGGGSGGSVRDAGGAFGKREAALENKFMHELELQQIQDLKKYLEEEVEHHKHQIKRHKEAIERHEKKIGKLRHKKDD